jgi:hypothetical protein
MLRSAIWEATHVKLLDGQVERIASKWGIGPNGTLAKPSEGGFGVVTENGRRVNAYEAHSYWFSTSLVSTFVREPAQ